MKKQERPIALRDLGRSLRSCHRIEDTIWAKLRALGRSERSSAADIRLALIGIGQQCPEWCEQAAWDTIADSFARWAALFGDLRLFMALRRKRDS